MPKLEYVHGPRARACPKCRTNDWIRNVPRGWKCRECNRHRAEHWNNYHPGVAKKRRREWYLKNRAHSDAYQTQHRRIHPERYLVFWAKQRAKRYGLEFSLVPDDIVLPTACPVLGIPIEWKPGAGRAAKWNSPSLDRLDSSKGYTPENVRVISTRANMLKSNGTVAEHRAIADWMEREGA